MKSRYRRPKGQFLSILALASILTATAALLRRSQPGRRKQPENSNVQPAGNPLAAGTVALLQQEIVTGFRDRKIDSRLPNSAATWE